MMTPLREAPTSMNTVMTDQERLLLAALHTCINALRRIDRAKLALDEGAGDVLHDNPDRLAQQLNEATAQGQNVYLQASMLLDRLGMTQPGGTRVQEPVELTAVGFTGTELAYLIRACVQEWIRSQRLAEQAETPRNNTPVADRRADQQLWLGLSSRLTAALVAAS